MRRLRRFVVVLFMHLAACAPERPPVAPAPQSPAPRNQNTLRAEIEAELEDLHAAAAAADEARYLSHFGDAAVFLGTDATEHWDMPAFRAFVHDHFSKGHGWTYKARRRAISFAADDRVAIFDEDLDNERLGPTRGTGVLARDAAGGHYRILQYNLTFTIPNERVEAMRGAVVGEGDLRAQYKHAYESATEAADAGDLAGARRYLAVLVPAAKTKPAEDVEFWVHNELTWIAWASGDLGAALGEVDEAKWAVEHALLDPAAKNKLRLHERWDRAYVLLEMALAAPPAQRSAALAGARAAKADYDALATREHDADGAAVLEAFFALRTGEAKKAAAAAAKVDVEKDGDVQDLYVIVRAFELAGDTTRAARVQARLCDAPRYLMKPLVVAARAKEKHACP
jgi:hypothetical protein